MKPASITILGAGRWGTAIASLLADNGHHVTMWCKESDVADDINNDHINKLYCPEFILHKNIRATGNIAEAVRETLWIFEATPVTFLRTIVQQTKHHVNPQTHWVVLSKGIEADTLKLPTQIIQDVLGHNTTTSVFGGPTFAQELLTKQFSAADIANTNKQEREKLATLLNNDYFVSHLSSDPIGVQVGGAIKNVFALMIGLAHGSGFKDNTTAYLLTRALQEMIILVKALGGNRETIYGLSGLGDMILSCTGSHSKNLKAGTLLAQGLSMNDLIREFGTLPEGLNTLESIHQLITKNNLTLPLCQTTYAIIMQRMPVEELLRV